MYGDKSRGFDRDLALSYAKQEGILVQFSRTEIAQAIPSCKFAGSKLLQDFRLGDRFHLAFCCVYVTASKLDPYSEWPPDGFQLQFT
jgi:hypothetical protein